MWAENPFNLPFKSITKKLGAEIPNGSSQKLGDSWEWLLARVDISQFRRICVKPSGGVVTAD